MILFIFDKSVENRNFLHDNWYFLLSRFVKSVGILRPREIHNSLLPLSSSMRPLLNLLLLIPSNHVPWLWLFPPAFDISLQCHFRNSYTFHPLLSGLCWICFFLFHPSFVSHASTFFSCPGNFTSVSFLEFFQLPFSPKVQTMSLIILLLPLQCCDEHL